mmetsp:Transcript_16011/g.29034  ORF Transcript_16011/g.29034 Transcript_16011/m.29034 type:complete len:242 (+) Transcript_16011:523-1248(+)
MDGDTRSISSEKLEEHRHAFSCPILYCGSPNYWGYNPRMMSPWSIHQPKCNDIIKVNMQTNQHPMKSFPLGTSNTFSDWPMNGGVNADWFASFISSTLAPSFPRVLPKMYTTSPIKRPVIEEPLCPSARHLLPWYGVPLKMFDSADRCSSTIMDVMNITSRRFPKRMFGIGWKWQRPFIRWGVFLSTMCFYVSPVAQSRPCRITPSDVILENLWPLPNNTMPGIPKWDLGASPQRVICIPK